MRIYWTVVMLQSYRADGIVFCSRHSQVRRGITLKIYIQELWFLRSAHRLMLVKFSVPSRHDWKNVDWDVKPQHKQTKFSVTFHEDILNGFQVTERTALYYVLGITKVQGITKKIYIQELCFLWSAHRLMLVNISLTFHEDILNGFQVTELYSGRHCIMFLAFFTNRASIGHTT